MGVGWKTRSRKGMLALGGTEMVIEGSAECGRRTQRPDTTVVFNSIAN